MDVKQRIFLNKILITFPANAVYVGFLAKRAEIRPDNLKWRCIFYLVAAPSELIQAYINCHPTVKTIEILSAEGYRFFLDGVKLMSVGSSVLTADMQIVSNFILELSDVTFVEKVEPHKNPFFKKLGVRSEEVEKCLEPSSPLEKNK